MIGRTRDLGCWIRDIKRPCPAELCSGELSLGALGVFPFACINFRFFVDVVIEGRFGEKDGSRNCKGGVGRRSGKTGDNGGDGTRADWAELIVNRRVLGGIDIETYCGAGSASGDGGFDISSGIGERLRSRAGDGSDRLSMGSGYRARAAFLAVLEVRPCDGADGAGGTFRSIT